MYVSSAMPKIISNDMACWVEESLRVAATKKIGQIFVVHMT